jgi:putative acetyltransferase
MDGGETAAVPTDPNVAAFTIRPERDDDHEAIAAMVAAAFGSQAEADLVDAIRASPEYLPSLSLVVEVDGEVVGHVMVSLAEVRDGDQRHPIYNLSPLAVEPSRHGQGIGSALVRAVIRAAEEMGAPFVVLEGSPQYYGRFGFEPSTDYGITIDLPSWAPPEAAQIVLLRDYDTSIRGRVAYPAAFDAVIDH